MFLLMPDPHIPEIPTFMTELARKAGAHTRGLVRDPMRVGSAGEKKMDSLVAQFNVKV
jgi:hypothetical protein